MKFATVIKHISDPDNLGVAYRLGWARAEGFDYARESTKFIIAEDGNLYLMEEGSTNKIPFTPTVEDATANDWEYEI
jgi:hypothetical protein